MSDSESDAFIDDGSGSEDYGASSSKKVAAEPKPKAVSPIFPFKRAGGRSARPCQVFAWRVQQTGCRWRLVVGRGDCSGGLVD